MPTNKARRPIHNVLFHEAGHAAAAWELGLRIVSLHINRSPKTAEVRFASALAAERPELTSDRARELAEREIVVFHAGGVAEKRFHCESADASIAVHDYAQIYRTARQFTDDDNVIDAWSEYLQQRARKLIEQPATWSRIVALVLDLSRRFSAADAVTVDGNELETFLSGVNVPSTSAFLAYRRRESRGVVQLLEPVAIHRRVCRAIDRASQVLKRVGD